MKRVNHMDEPISISTAAAEFKVSPATLRRAAGLGTLDATKTGPRAWVTTRRAVMVWKETPTFHKTGKKPQ